MTANYAVMICGHGSRDDGAVEEFNQLSHHLRDRLPGVDVESGFLEFATPVIRDGLNKLKARGAKRIVCVPGMLFAAGRRRTIGRDVGAGKAQTDLLFGGPDIRPR